MRVKTPVDPPVAIDVRFVLPVRCRTKKTSNRLVGRRGKRQYILPSEEYVVYEKAACLLLSRAQVRGLFVCLPHEGVVNCAAIFGVENGSHGDLVGYQQALADILQKAGVLRNDKQIRGWDGSRIAVNRGAPPSVIVRLTSMTEDGRVLW